MYDLKFNEADLSANRRGELSDAQRKRLDADVDTLRRHSKYVYWIFAACLVVLLAVGAITEFNNAKGDVSRFLSEDTFMGFGVVAISFLCVFGIIFGWNWWTLRHLDQGVVSFAEGRAQAISTFTYVRGIKAPIHLLRLHRGWFRRSTFRFLSAQSLRFFKTGRHYRMYYIRYPMPYLLSAEEIDEKAKNEA